MKIFYRDHNSSGTEKRVWREDWSGDQFEILNEQEFTALELLCAKLSFNLEQADDE